MSKSFDVSTGIKAMVTDENGEISCSVDETNRIRALLGLRPLNNEKGSNEREAVQNFHANRDKERREKETSELREKLEKSREKRILNTKVRGNTLGETKGEDEFLSAADWVKRSRKKEKEVINDKDKAILQAEAAMKRLEEEEEEAIQNGTKYNASHLKGLQVMHSVKDFDIGQEVILTLADSSILEKDDDGHVLGITGESDFLENVNMTDTDRRLDRERRAKRLKQPVYTAYDDAEFAEGRVPGSRPSILSQYDEEKKCAPKFSLGEDGATVMMQEDEATLELRKKLPVAQSLKITAKDVSDYYTKAEYTSFAKPKSGKEKKMRRVRKVEEEVDPLEGIEDDLSGSAVNADRGSRKNGNGNGEKAASSAATLESKKRKAYEQAGVMAAEKSKRAFAIPTTSSLPPRTVTFTAEEDDDADMAQSLARARRLALSQQSRNRAVAEETEEDYSARRVRELVHRTQETAANNEASKISNSYKSVSAAFSATSASGFSASSIGATAAKINEGEIELEEDSLDAEGRRPDGTLVFTGTTEFTSRLQARLTEKARSRAEAVVRAAAAAEQLQMMEIQMEDSAEGSSSSPIAGTGKVYARAEGGGEGNGADEWVNMDLEREGEGDGEEESDEDEQMGFVHKQPLVATGMAATLALLKGSGELGKSEELAGRAKDGRVVDPSAKVDGVKLEYRDEFGRKLTQKEAFRQICYRFHGYGPGKKAKEKRLKAMDDQSKALSSRGVVDSGTMRSLVRAQEATGKAHVTIQGGEKSASGGITAAELLAIRNKKVAKGPATNKSNSGNKSSITK